MNNVTASQQSRNLLIARIEKAAGHRIESLSREAEHELNARLVALTGKRFFTDLRCTKCGCQSVSASQTLAWWAENNPDPILTGDYDDEPRENCCDAPALELYDATEE